MREVNANDNDNTRFTLRLPGAVDFSAQEVDEISPTVQDAVLYWEANGVRFRIDLLGAKNVETGETVYERREHIVVDNVPPFLMTGAEWAYLRQHEAEFIRYLKQRQE